VDQDDRAEGGLRKRGEGEEKEEREDREANG
jgi:hypothetical protein